MKKYTIMTLGIGMIVGFLIERYATGENVSKAKKAVKDKVNDIFDPKFDYLDDADIIVDESVMTAAMNITDETPDGVDYLFIEPISVPNMSTAYSIMGEVHVAFETGRDVTIKDILDWINQYEYDFYGMDLYTDKYRWAYKDELKEYGWVDPSDFEITYDLEKKAYRVTTAAPVRLNHDNIATKTEEENTTNDAPSENADDSATGGLKENTEKL